jgi:hypothetical protein
MAAREGAAKAATVLQLDLPVRGDPGPVRDPEISTPPDEFIARLEQPGVQEVSELDAPSS